MEEYRRSLERAAARDGIDPGYWDIWGKWHTVSVSAQKAILASMGVAVETSQAIERSLEERSWREWTRLLPPVLVLYQDSPVRVSLRIPVAWAGRRAVLELRLEDGAERRLEFSLDECADTARAELRGIQFVEKELIAGSDLPLGYHEIRVAVQEAAAPGAARLIICAARAWLPPALSEGARRAGLAVSLYGVHSARTWGCGDFTALEGVVDFVASRIGGAFVALNPLHSIPNRQPYNTSPYLPNSLYYLNPIYLDVTRIQDLEECPRANALLASDHVRREIAELNRSEFVEYERVFALKWTVLKLLFRSFRRNHLRPGTERARQFQRYIESEGDLLHLYAVYCALDEHIHRLSPNIWVWPDWPEPYRDPNSDATRRFAGEHSRSVLYHKYVQWQLDLQLARAQDYARAKGLSIGLFHDLPLATDRCGSDLWAHGRFYVAGCRVGAPPDDFSPKGQDWGFPPPNAGAHYEDGYRHFAASIRRSCRHGGALRIDHVMRLFRLYWIPDGSDATGGAYVRDARHEDLLRILALESVRGQSLVVGEDLGTVEDYIRNELARFGFLSYRLFYFEKHGDGTHKQPGEYPQAALVSSTTHDLPTLAGFWLGRDIEARRNAGLLPDQAGYEKLKLRRQAEKQAMLDALFRLGLLLDWYPRSAAQVPELTGELHNAIIGFLCSTPCLLLTLNQEDLTKETEQQNLPASTHQYPNWRRKMKFSVEELRGSPAVADFARMFRSWLERTGRLEPLTREEHG